MIRTTLSFCLLFGGLLLASKWMHQSSHHEQPITETNAPLAPEQTGAEPKLIPISTKQPTTELQPAESNAIQLVGFNDPVDDVLDTLRSEGPPIVRIADAEAAKRVATVGDDQDASDTPIDGTYRSTEPEIALTPELLELRQRLRECLAFYYFRPENVAIRSPWGAMHAMIAYGVDR